MTKKNKIKGIIALAIIMVTFYIGYNFSLFDEGLKKIKTIKLSDKKYYLEIYSIESNAVTESNIQIRRIDEGVQEVVKNYSGYSFLDSFSIRNDSLFVYLKNNLKKNNITKFSMKLPDNR